MRLREELYRLLLACRERLSRWEEERNDVDEPSGEEGEAGRLLSSYMDSTSSSVMSSSESSSCLARRARLASSCLRSEASLKLLAEEGTGVVVLFPPSPLFPVSTNRFLGKERRATSVFMYSVKEML